MQLGLFASPPKPWEATKGRAPAFEAHLEALRDETRGAAYEAAELDPRTAPGYTPTAAEAHALRSSVATLRAALPEVVICAGCGVVLEGEPGPLCEALCGPEALYEWEERAAIAGEEMARELLGDKPPKARR